MQKESYRIYELDTKSGSLDGYFVEVDKPTDSTTKRYDASLFVGSTSIDEVKIMTEAAYNALVVKDATTLYLIH
jgi:hypothetical protein